MYTDIKISTKTKKNLEKLQNLLMQALGRKITLPEVIDIVVEKGLKDFDSIVQHFSKKRKLSEDEIEKILSELPMDLHVETSEEDIDETVYGEK